MHTDFATPLLISTAFLGQNKKAEPLQTVDLQGFQMVEVTGFEPVTFWSRTAAMANVLYKFIA